MNKVAGDIRYAFRQMRRAPGIAATAVLTHCNLTRSMAPRAPRRVRQSRAGAAH
jgi:hypothetical protein